MMPPVDKVIERFIKSVLQAKRDSFIEQAMSRVEETHPHLTPEQTAELRLKMQDEIAAHFYGKIMGRRKELEKPLSILDGQIAAIARANNVAVATCNIKDFSDCGLDLINPF